MQRFDDAHERSQPNLIPEPEALLPLLQIVDNDQFDYQVFCEAAEAFPAIRHQIIRTAQFITGNHRGEVLELRHAIAIIGMQRLRRILQVHYSKSEPNVA